VELCELSPETADEFDCATGAATLTRPGYSQLATGLVSATAHVVVLALVAIPALYATDILPAPPDMVTFVRVAPPPHPSSATSRGAQVKKADVKPSPDRVEPEYRCWHSAHRFRES
jgi:hypothetical protein